MALSETQGNSSPLAVRPRRWRRRIQLAGAVLALAAGTIAWLDRERIAADVIDGYLRAHGVSARYDILAIDPHRQVITNIVVGDPARPDLTAKQVVVELGIGWSGPRVRKVRIVGARLFATWKGGKLSLGTLDPLVFTGSKEPPALPTVGLELVDARALLESDYGAVGLWLEGRGRLDNGFAGTLAATAPGIAVAGCRAKSATLYGALTTKRGAPVFAGPLRLGGVRCGGARLAQLDIGTKLALRRDFAAVDGDFALSGSGLALAGVTGERLEGTARLSWQGNRLVLAHDIALSALAAPQGQLARLAVQGRWRSSDRAARGEWQGRLSGTGLSAATAPRTLLAEAETRVAGSLLAPLLAKARGGLAQALEDARFSADAIIRYKPGALTLAIPDAALATRAGERVLALSRFSTGLARGALTGLAGDVLIGGAGLPTINGRMAQGPDGGWFLRMAMADYRADGSRLAIPRLTLRQERGGAISFDGLVSASGTIPGGAVHGLELPIQGRWSKARGLALGMACTPVRFRAAVLSGLMVRGQQVTLCPARGAPLLTYDARLTLAAATGPLMLVGKLGETPVWLSAARAVLRYPGSFRIERLAARFGAPGSATRLAFASLTGKLDGPLEGELADGAARIDPVPLDLDAIAGRWSFADGALRIVDASFTLSDRPPAGQARFAPLAASGAQLTLAEGVIRAESRLSHPGSGRVVADVSVTHDLAAVAGNARFTVPGLAFDKRLQPADLSYLASGVIALADGTVTGEGRIDWRGGKITSSGSFASDRLDFAAAFGPVRALAGRVVFTDLLNLTTAPDQKLFIGAINPGIEVLGGTVQFELQGGTLLRLEDARFPFMGGELVLRPLVLDLSQPEERRYVFDITGLDAARFVAQMELSNIAATGIFDGTVPIIFDAEGRGRIEHGLLLSRAPGGNLAYVGELTYKDLGSMGNYAFAALRSLDYRQMAVGLNGSLGGEIITNFDFDGVRQGSGASQNFVTRRIARLPIRFRVNVRSENFYQLMTMVRSFWDVSYLGSPVDRGLLKVENGRFVPARPAGPAAPPTDEAVQLPESELQS